MGISRNFLFCSMALSIAGATLVLGPSDASASPVLMPDFVGRTSLVLQDSGAHVEEAQYRGRGQYRWGNRQFRRADRHYRRHGRRDYRRSHWRGYRPYRRYGPRYDYWGPGIGFGLGFVLGQGLYYPPPPPTVIYTPVPSVGGACAYWLARCEANWSRPQDVRGCLRYQGCL